MEKLVYILLIYTSISCNSKNSTIINTDNKMQADTILQKFEIDKYLGTWYEIARFDHSFERNLVGVTATYSKLANGKIEVLNSGYKNNFEGKFKTAKGKAKIPDNKFPYKLKVSFFLFFYADYTILKLDENYGWALIGSTSPDYLWVLSRNPTLDENVYQSILSSATEMGYRVENLIKVKHKTN